MSARFALSFVPKTLQSAASNLTGSRPRSREINPVSLARLLMEDREKRALRGVEIELVFVRAEVVFKRFLAKSFDYIGSAFSTSFIFINNIPLKILHIINQFNAITWRNQGDLYPASVTITGWQPLGNMECNFAKKAWWVVSFSLVLLLCTSW